MRNILKATTLESKFPLLAVEGGCIISKDADITVVYRVELPELFTVTSAEYEAKALSCLSRMRGNSHVRFLGGKGAVMSLTYPTSSASVTARPRARGT